MPPEEGVPDGAAAPRPSAKAARDVDRVVSINRETLNTLIEELRQFVMQTIRDEVSAQRKKPGLAPQGESRATPQTSQADQVAPPLRGVDAPLEERLKARDLRMALLLGKIPENAGLLINAETTAQFMGISQSTPYRLIDEKAVPPPVRIWGRLLRWRLAEILEWIEAGCPHMDHWTFGPSQTWQWKQRK